MSASAISVIGSVPNQRIPSASPCTVNSDGASLGKTSRNDSREVVSVGNVPSVSLPLMDTSAPCVDVSHGFIRLSPIRSRRSNVRSWAESARCVRP
ncbi:hypothetical protein BVI434_480010 [Burkholderia vietnamiensis]|nr:hypothetical protein BVI434_480010 [Burkholderia vietnamiensis]